MRRIASRQNPIVERFRSAARRESDDVILLDGAHLVGEAIAAGVRIFEAAIAAEAGSDPEIVQLAARLSAARIETVTAIAPVMAALSPVRSPSSIVALASRPARSAAMFNGTPLLLVACDIQDPGNVGAIVRVAEAAGATGAVVAGVSADPFGWKALRGSMGSALRLPVDVRKAGYSFDDLRTRGCRIVAASPRNGRSLFDANLGGAVALVVGSEGSGLSARHLEQADELVTIPMQPPVESLNASVTAALLAYEARRRRS